MDRANHGHMSTQESLKGQGLVHQGPALLDDEHDYHPRPHLGRNSLPEEKSCNSLIELSDNEASLTLSRIVEDLRDYEIEDDSFGGISPTSSTSSDSDTPTVDHIDLADEQAQEFPFGRPLPPIPATGAVENLRRAPSPLPPFEFPARTPPPRKMPNSNVPKPGPAKLSPRAGLDEWLAEAKQCHYLPEAVMKQLCEMVKECLMEGE